MTIWYINRPQVSKSCGWTRFPAGRNRDNTEHPRSGNNSIRLETIMLRNLAILIACLVLSPWPSSPLNAQERTDTRKEMMQDPNSFQLRINIPTTLGEWEARKERLRQKVLVNAGLWPSPDKTPLNANTFERKEGKGFAVSKVYFESLPGYLVTGNLYEPLGGSGPYPAVLTPHGHWEYGRLQNQGAGSIPGRCIDLARQGFVVFSPDMIGYNDSFQLPHDSNKALRQMKAGEPLPWEPRAYRPDFVFPEAEFNGLSLGGLQLWNNIRAIDFLVSRDNVDPERIGATGASGGASQVILLIAADDRVAVAAPVNIIGAERHPGCRCENIPNLWIDTSTLELTATFAPKPLLMVSATDDPWTPRTPEREFPMMKRFYDLYGAGQNIENAHVEGPHNFNADSRAAMYKWFVKHLDAQGPLITDPEDYAEVSGLGDLRVFPERVLPEEAASAQRVIDDWIENSRRQFLEALPGDQEEYGRFRTDFRRALALNLSVSAPEAGSLEYSVEAQETRGDIIYTVEKIGAADRAGWVELESASRDIEPSRVALAVYPDKLGSLLNSDGTSDFPWLKPLLDRKYHVYHVRGYASGRLSVSLEEWDSYSWSDAYNRSNLTNGILDIVTAIRSIREAYPDAPLTLIGLDDRWLAAACAAALDGHTDRVVLDMNGTDPGYWRELHQIFPVHGFQRIGGLKTVFLLLAESDLLVFNPAESYDLSWLRERIAELGLSGNLNLLEKERKFNPNHLR